MAFNWTYWRRRAQLLFPSSMVGRLALYFALLRVLMFVLHPTLLLAGFDAAAQGLSGWAFGFSCVLAVLVTILGYRWFRDRFLWHVRNRLLVVYVFIGVVPVALVMLMALIAGYLFANQYAASQVHLRLEAEARNLEVVGAKFAADLEAALKRGGNLNDYLSVAQMDEQYPGLGIAVWVDGKMRASSHTGFPADPQLPEWVNAPYRGIVLEGDKLYLRSVSILDSPKGHVVVVASAPLHEKVMKRSASKLGSITLFRLVRTMGKGERKSGLVISDQRGRGPETDNPDVTPEPTAAGGDLPKHSETFAWDPEQSYGSLSYYRDWKTGVEKTGALQVKTRLSALYDHLFETTGSFSEIVLGALIGVGLFFAVIVMAAVFVGLGMTKRITGSVSNLYEATQFINRGDLKHRIQVKSKDQLAALQTSFNSMTESLERLLEEQKEKQRLESELAIAQEVQATLFPQRLSELKTLELHGVVRPARTVSGDYYDFLPGAAGSERLALAVGDIAGKGISAALLMATVHSAVRAYEYGRMPERHELLEAGSAAIAGAALVGGAPALAAMHGIQSPAEALTLLNRHLFFSTQDEKYATLFLGVWEGHKRTLTFSNAGHLPPLIISEDGSLKRLEAGGMVIGLFDNMAYAEDSVELRHNDIFVAYSDGVTEPENEFGEFGEARLIELVREHHKQPLARISEVVLAAVQDWIGSAEQPDDVTLVLARSR